MATNDRLELEIEGMAHDGRGIAFLPGAGRGKAVFVAGALPGQRALCRITSVAKSWLAASAERILIRAPGQLPPICSQSDSCGCCPLQTLPRSVQSQWKERIALEAMRRIGGFQSIDGIWEGVRTPSTVTRNKMTFAFGPDCAPGLRRDKSHDVVPIKDCAIVAADAVALASSFGLAARASGLPPYNGKAGFWRFLTLRRDRKGWRIICVTSPGSKIQRRKAREAACRVLEAHDCVQAVIHEERKERDFLSTGQQRIFCLDRTGVENPQGAIVRHDLGGMEFCLDSASFFQVNEAGAELLARVAVEYDDASPCSRDTLFDLYCGSGAPGQLLAPRYSRLLGLEADSRAIEYARMNARQNRLVNCRYERANLNKNLRPFPETTAGRVSVLLDPPRAGLGAGALAQIMTIRPEKIIYISCNAATLARDLKLLAESFTLERMAGVDMFPHTPHLECVALLQGRG